MLNILVIFLSVSILLISFLGITNIININNDESICYKMLKGFCYLFGLFQLLMLPLNLPYLFSLCILSILLIISFIYGIKFIIYNIKSIRMIFSKQTVLKISIILIIILGFTYISDIHTIGSRYIDTDFYLHLSDLLNDNPTKQHYYTFWGLFVNYFNMINNFIVKEVIFIWSSTIIFYILLVCFLIEITKSVIKNTNYINILFVSIASLFIISQTYTVDAAFLGNSYRTLIISFFSYKLYKMITNKEDSHNDYIEITFIISAMLSVSSSSFFIMLFMLLPFLIIDVSKLYQKTLYILVVSIVYCYSLCNNNIFLFIIAIALILFVHYILTNFMNSKQLKITLIIISIGLTIGSLIVFDIDIPRFLDPQYKFDRVYDLFDFYDSKNMIMNIFIITSMLFWIINSNNDTLKKYFFYFILLYNPLTYKFISYLMAGIVYYRLNDVLFNWFTFTVSFVYFMNYLLDSKRILLVSAAILLLSSFIYVGCKDIEQDNNILNEFGLLYK